jgi:hypothetical protein
MRLAKAFRRQRPITTAVQRDRQTLPPPAYGNVVDATGLVLRDMHIAVRVANLLAEAEGVTTEDPKSRFGIV